MTRRSRLGKPRGPHDPLYHAPTLTNGSMAPVMNRGSRLEPYGLEHGSPWSHALESKPFTFPEMKGERSHLHPPKWDDSVLVTCWCEQAEVTVPLADVRAGVTASCGLPGCGTPVEQRAVVKPRRKPGRPKGSRNKPKPRSTGVWHLIECERCGRYEIPTSQAFCPECYGITGIRIASAPYAGHMAGVARVVARPPVNHWLDV